MLRRAAGGTTQETVNPSLRRSALDRSNSSRDPFSSRGGADGKPFFPFMVVSVDLERFEGTVDMSTPGGPRKTPLDPATGPPRASP